MNSRQERILSAIMDAFLRSASPVGSKFLYQEYGFQVSPATIRNDMAALESEGWIYQPHTSAGRVPTGQAYRSFVDQLIPDAAFSHRVRQDLLKAHRKSQLQKLKERLYEMVSILADVTKNISFATLPDKERVFYIGVSRMIRQPEFMAAPEKASQVVEVLEHTLYELLQEMEVGDEVVISIGKENLLPAMHSCSMLAIRYRDQGYEGVMGLLGPTRMNYPYNLAALREVIKLF